MVDLNGDPRIAKARELLQEATTLLAQEVELLTINEGARLYEIPVQTIHTWIRAGHLPIEERRKGPGPGGVIYVAKHILEHLLNHPPKVGRPKENGHDFST